MKLYIGRGSDLQLSTDCFFGRLNTQVITAIISTETLETQDGARYRSPGYVLHQIVQAVV